MPCVKVKIHYFQLLPIKTPLLIVASRFVNNNMNVNERVLNIKKTDQLIRDVNALDVNFFILAALPKKMCILQPTG